MKSAFSGYIPEIPFILVDNFENHQKSAYFLSHYHSDHIIGLNSSYFPRHLERNNGYIYASAVTIAIIKTEWPELSPYLKVLKLGRNTLTIKENDEEIYLNVTVLPAGHSLGSVMFLFTNKQTILYTGDFRITQNSISTYTHLHKNGEPIEIDALYVDTTFQNVNSFPRRSEVVRNVGERVRDWLNMSEKNRVVILTSAGYGYECVCNEIYTATGLKTYIDDLKWNIFRQFPKEMYGITNDKKSRIHLITKYANTGNCLDSREILTIYFSAMKWGTSIDEESYINIVKENRIDVCFATHCGRDELTYFITYFKPKKIVGFPNEYIKVPTSSSPLTFDISPRSEKRKANSDDENSEIGKKITKSVVKKLFEW